MLKRFKPGLRSTLIAGTALLLLGTQIAALFPNVTTPVERLDYAAHDLMMSLRGAQKPSDNIVIVAIDDASLNWTGMHWPWSRKYLAEIVDQINAGGAKIAGVDVLLVEPDPDPNGDLSLANALGHSPHAASVIEISRDSNQNTETLSLPLSPYRSVFAGMGITSFVLDEDAILRGVQAYDVYGNNIYYHWAFHVARLYLGSDPPKRTGITTLSFNNKTIYLRGGQMLIDYKGPAETFKTYSAYDVHDGITLKQDPNAFRDKIVLIGATSNSLKDNFPTPFSAKKLTPGVEVVANAVDMLINGKYLRESPPWMQLLITIAAALLSALLSRSQRPTLTVTLLGASMLVYAAGAYFIFTRTNFILPVIAPEVMLFLGVVLPTLEQAVSQELEKRRVRNLFGRFISPEMVDQMMETRDLSLLNKRATLTILFSDIRGFTTMSEKLPPEEVVALLNTYLEAMSRIIHKHGGTVDKYEGDAIVAFFGEPVPYEDHAQRATHAAVEMLHELTNLSARWMREGRPVQKLDIGVGLNTGEVFVGLIGSAQRINYTVIGDNANLASRLQDLTKTYQWPILISESTYENIKDEFEAEFVDSVLVKGKSEAVNLYKVLGKKGRKGERVQGWK